MKKGPATHQMKKAKGEYKTRKQEKKRTFKKTYDYLEPVSKPKKIAEASVSAMYNCRCWDPNSTSPCAPGSSPSFWCREMFDQLCSIEPEAMRGAKAFMCADANVPRGVARVLHIMIRDGKTRITMPVLAASDDGATPLYVQREYCVAHDKFERESKYAMKPDSPIRWIRCASVKK